MIIKSKPKVAQLNVGRNRNDDVSFVIVYAEDDVPTSLFGKDVRLIFEDLRTGSNYLTKQPSQYDDNKAIITLTSVDKTRIKPEVTGISLQIEGVTLAKGNFTWSAEFAENSSNPEAIGINYRTLDATTNWFEVVIGPYGKTAYVYAVEHGYTGTEEEFGYAMADLVEARDEAVEARDETLLARDVAVQAKEDAEEAQEASEAAQVAAEAAQSIAESARDNANLAKNAAILAQSKAEEAQAAAEDAQIASESARDETVNARDIAVQAKDDAVAAKLSAEESEGIAVSAKDTAVSARDTAVLAKDTAVSAKDIAESARDEAVDAKDDAEAAAQSAKSDRDDAEQFRNQAEEFRDETQVYRDDAEEFRDNAYDYMFQAEQHRDDAEYFAFLAGLGSPAWYGVEYTASQTSPTLTRIGNMEMHRYLPLHNRIRHCLLSDNGSVTLYTHANSQWQTQEGFPLLLDGSEGQRMIEIPETYWRYEVEGSQRRIKLSEYPLPGFFRVPRFYVSPTGACIQRSTGKLCSVFNEEDPDYRGGNNTSAWDDDFSKTLLGREVSNLSLTAARDAARLRGPGWESYNIIAHEVIMWLIRIEYATFDVQAPYNPTLDGNGFRQGGLGNGVTTLNNSLWSAWNNSNPFLPTSIGADFGNRTGIFPYNMPSEYSATPVTVEVPVWRGMANPFGYMWRWLDGVLVNAESNGSGGRTQAYVCYDPSKFSSSSYLGYTLVGNLPRATGFISYVYMNDRSSFFPAGTGGSSSTYLCDQIYSSFPGSGSETRGMLVGGWPIAGLSGGLNCIRIHDTPTTSNVIFGTRLCFHTEHPSLS